MKDSLLKLESISFRKLLIEAQPNPSTSSTMEVADSVKFFQNEADPALWRVELDLKIGSPAGETLAYACEVSLIGTFCVSSDVSETSAINLVRVNASAILYSAAREMICNVTARGPHAMLVLPSRTFIDLKVDSATDSEARTNTKSPNAKEDAN